VILSNNEACVNFSAFGPSFNQSTNQPVPKIAATTGEPIIANNVTTVTKPPKVPDTLPINSRVLDKSPDF